MDLFHEDHPAWLAQVTEAIIDPGQPIIDPHHHLWPNMMGDIYNVDELAIDTGAGHNIIGTVFMECGTCYREEGPEHEKSLGETEYVLAQAARIRELALGAPILGMVGHVDLRETATLDDALDKHIDLAGDFFKGIRHAGASARDADRESLLIPGAAPADLYRLPDFQAGVRRLGERGLSYDTWQYHYQLRDYIALAKACPDPTMILDHFSTPLGVGSFEGQHDSIFETWKDELGQLSHCPNVFLKLGGLAMPDNGFGWHLAERPPSSDELLAAHGRWYRHALDCFGARRCMFESNFPVDRLSLSYTVYYNAMKKLSADFSIDEKTALFTDTARRVYRLNS
ncbi:MAG: amidohydrolase family protein [Congregibacter sp.]|nr:amidohydrolase family protein [Congregibacter sp.]